MSAFLNEYTESFSYLSRIGGGRSFQDIAPRYEKLFVEKLIVRENH